MNATAHQILIVTALLLTVISFFKPQWPLLSVAVLLLCVDQLTKN